MKQMFDALSDWIRRHAAMPMAVGASWPRRVALLALLPLFALAASTFAQPADVALSEAAALQIQALLAEKEARTPAQRKIDSNLLYASRMQRGIAAAPGVATLDTGVETDAAGLVGVDVRAMTGNGVEQIVVALGGTVLRTFEFAASIEALLPLDQLEVLAADPRVVFIALPSDRTTHRMTRANVDVDTKLPGAPSAPLSPRLKRFSQTVQAALTAYVDGNPNCCGGAIINAGVRNSQGDVAHRANQARAVYQVNGAGLRIGVLSDSFNSLGTAAADVASGDLPGPGNPNGFLTPVTLAGSGDFTPASDEGRAMLQIVHDLAPGATLYFATANNSITDFANNIRALRGIASSAPPFGNVTPGCNIIIDDVFYFVESALHDGQPAPSTANMAAVIQAVNDVVANGALYFSSAGNEGSVTQGTAGAWEGDYAGTALPGPLTAMGADGLNWGGGNVGNALNVVGSRNVLQWADPIGGSANDYDFFRLNSTLTSVLASSTNLQTGTQDPTEQVTSGAVGNRLVVVRKAGAALRFMSMTTFRGRLQTATSGQTRGHSIANGAYSVAATPAAATFGAPTPDGPYPGPFVASNQVEAFSSDGPRRIFFTAAGAPYTPGNFSSTGGIVRQKPDITAADGVDTTLPAASGLNPFYGTSAAAPHAGAIAALIKQASPASTPAQIRTFLTSTALDIMAPGVDNTSGVGIVQAFQAVQATGKTGAAAFDLSAITVTRTPTPGLLLPGDSGMMVIRLVNFGVATASGISATLTTTTPCISIGTGVSAYPSVGAGGTTINATPFTFSLSAACVCPVTIAFRLVVTFTGGSSTIDFNVATGPPALVIDSTLDASAPAGLPASIVGTTGTQTGRLNRGGTPGTCAAPIAPLLQDSVARRYDAYAFTMPATPANSCVTVTLANNVSTADMIMPVAYVGGAFNPASILTNAAGSAGVSVGGGGSVSFSVNAAANQVVTITLNDVNTGITTAIPYTLTIGGVCGVQGAPILAFAALRRTHGGSGTYDLPLAATPTNPTTEPRSGTSHTAVFTFNKPVVSGTVSVTEGTATAGAPTFVGTEMRVPLTGVTNAQYVSLSVSNVNGADGGTGGASSVRFGALEGDVNGSRVVTLSDVGQVNALLAQSVTPFNFTRDINATGSLTVADKGLTNARLTTFLPAP